MFECCSFSSELHGARKLPRSPVSTVPTLPRYQIIIESEAQLPSPRRSSSFTTAETSRYINQGQRWKYENGRFLSRHCGLVMEANKDRTGVVLWSRRPINAQTQIWKYVNGCILHESSGLFLEATEDGQVILADAKVFAVAGVVLSSEPTSLPGSFTSYESLSNLSKVPVTSPSIEESAFTRDPAQKWRISSKGYIINKATNKVLVPVDFKMGSKIVLREKDEPSYGRNRASSFK